MLASLSTLLQTIAFLNNGVVRRCKKYSSLHVAALRAHSADLPTRLGCKPPAPTNWAANGCEASCTSVATRRRGAASAATSAKLMAAGHHSVSPPTAPRETTIDGATPLTKNAAQRRRLVRSDLQTCLQLATSCAAHQR